MKKIFCVVSAATLAMTVLADTRSATGVGAVADPAAAPTQRTVVRPAAPPPRTVPLVAGPAVVSVSPSSRVNVRGRAGLIGEVIARLTNSEPVMVLEEIQLRRSGPDEPSAWARIVLPEKAKAWVHASYIDPTNKTVIPRRLNLRGGPGENYSVLGTMERGAAVTELQRQGDWIEIQPPASSYAFVAAQYLKQDSLVAAEPEPAPALEPQTEAVPPTTLPESPTLASTVTETPAEPAGLTNEAAPVTDALVQEQEPPPPRIVQREGLVRGVGSIQAPTRFELMSPDTRRTINYLYSSSPGLDLSRYKGLRIVVTGEESLDERWRNTPIITIQRIQVLE